MIKIDIDSCIIEDIKTLYLADIKKGTGLICMLEEKKDNLLEYHPDIYSYFFPNGYIDVASVSAILFATYDDMLRYIEHFGVIQNSELLKETFGYNRFIKRKIAYTISEKLDIRVCPYCNRQYTFTLSKEHIRPQFDHYFPKSKYPYLALSFYNLIPCCGTCNLSKSDLDTKASPILYPYLDEFGYETRFGTEISDDNLPLFIQGLSDEFKLKLNKGGGLSEKAKNHSERLCLLELYNQHKDYVKDILKNCYINTPQRMNEMLTLFPTLFANEQELCNTILMSRITKNSWGNRPLSKLTADIVDEYRFYSKGNN